MAMRRRAFIAGLGSAAAWPLVANAQQSAMPVIGFMSGRSQADSDYLVTAFREGLVEAGFTEGVNVSVMFRWAGGQPDRLPALAAELVARPVAMLVGVGGDLSARAAKQATSTIPVVFGMGDDPVKAGLVDSFNRPGGNATGFTLWTNRLESKRLGLLHELVPNVAVVGILLNPKFPSAAIQLQEIEGAARAINQTLLVKDVSSDDELTSAFAGFMEQQIGAMQVAAEYPAPPHY
jgi:putative tryptophan/tyrosine transport system substrate-binding protein